MSHRSWISASTNKSRRQRANSSVSTGRCKLMTCHISATSPPSTSSSVALPSGGETMMAEQEESVSGMDPSSFLWEQISSSLDPVELHEVERVVGISLIRESQDVYAEVRALHEILADYSARTDDLVRASTKERCMLNGSGTCLLELELQQLVRQLRSRAAAAGVPETTLLPSAQSSQRKTLEAVMREAEEPEWQGGAERLSIRDMRPGSSWRPGTASSRPGSSRPGTGSTRSRSHNESRPGTGSAAGRSRHQALGSGLSSPGGSEIGWGEGALSQKGSRPPSAGSHGSASTSGSFAAEAMEGGRRSRGGVVISQLRAALEEERMVLLAQAEGLRLSIDDEHEYREKSVVPSPSLTQLQELKRSLHANLDKAEHVAALTSRAPSREIPTKRGALSRFSLLPDVSTS